MVSSPLSGNTFILKAYADISVSLLCENFVPMVSFWLFIPRLLGLEVWRIEGSRWLTIHFPPETPGGFCSPTASLDEEESGECLCMRDAWGIHFQPWLHIRINKKVLKTGGAKDSDLMGLGYSLGIGSFKISPSDSKVCPSPRIVA